LAQIRAIEVGVKLGLFCFEAYNQKLEVSALLRYRMQRQLTAGGFPSGCLLPLGALT